MFIQKILFPVFALCILIGCNNKGGNAADAAGQSAADKTPQRKEIKGMTGAQAAQLFGLSFKDLTEDLLLNGYYHAYTDASGKEILHGKFEVLCAQEMEEYAQAKGDGDGEAVINARWDYACMSYTGQYADGIKDGLFTQNYSGHEFGFTATILFDAKTGGCTEATLEGGAESTCVSFKGKVPSCNFDDIPRKEKEC